MAGRGEIPPGGQRFQRISKRWRASRAMPAEARCGPIPSREEGASGGWMGAGSPIRGKQKLSPTLRSERPGVSTDVHPYPV
jgi:hypothetical protein